MPKCQRIHWWRQSFFTQRYVNIKLEPVGTCHSGNSRDRRHGGEALAAGQVGLGYSGRSWFCSQQEAAKPWHEHPSKPLGIAGALNTQMAMGYLLTLPLCQERKDGAAYRLFLANIVICWSYFSCKSGKLFSLSY